MPASLATVSPMRLSRSSRGRTVARGSVAQNPAYAGRLYSRRAVDVRARLLAQCPLGGRSVEVVVHGRTVDLSRSYAAEKDSFSHFGTDISCHCSGFTGTKASWF